MADQIAGALPTDWQDKIIGFWFGELTAKDWFGGARPGTSVALDTYRMHYDGVTVLSPFHFRPRDVATAHELLTRRDVDWGGFITSRATLDQVPAVFASLENGKDVKCAILPQAEAGEVPLI